MANVIWDISVLVWSNQNLSPVHKSKSLTSSLSGSGDIKYMVGLQVIAGGANIWSLYQVSNMIWPNTIN